MMTSCVCLLVLPPTLTAQWHFLSTDVTLGTAVGQVKAKAKADIDPWLMGAGIAYKF